VHRARDGLLAFGRRREGRIPLGLADDGRAGGHRCRVRGARAALARHPQRLLQRATAVDDATSSGGPDPDVQQLQTDLNAVGCYAGAVDGIDGSETTNAVEEFQTAKGLTVDGKVGPETQAALDEVVKAGEIVCTPGSTTGATTASTADSTATDSTSSGETTDATSSGETTATTAESTTAETTTG
jgi:peptidoglycan hydrolase-like protein with peptidoglycan-binding domain